MPYGRIDSSAQDFAQKAATLLSTHIRYVLGVRGRCVLGLSGGSTPKLVYELLGKDPAIDWRAVSVFLIDERYVPPTHADSNEKMIRETLLKTAPIPSSQCIFPRTDLPLPACAEDYARRITAMLEDEPADIAVLGIGEDGHTASLFPKLGDEAFEDDIVIVTTTDKFAVRERISISLPFLTKIKLPIFLLQGEKKRAVWDEMIGASVDLRRWPAQAILATERAVAMIG